MDNATWYLKEPCIYDTNSAEEDILPLFRYNYVWDHNTSLPKTRLNIDGMNFYCRKSLTSLDASTAIVRIENNSLPYNGAAGTLWGLHINLNVTKAGSTPNYIGIEVYANSGSITFTEIWGYVSMTYMAYRVHANPSPDSNSDIWVTDTKIYGNSRCAKGGIFERGEPVRNFGSHQALYVFPAENDEAYFVANRFENYGYIWDLGLLKGGKYSCEYAVKPVNQSFQFDNSQKKVSPVSIVEPTDVFYPNLLSDTYKYPSNDIVVQTTIRCFNKDSQGNKAGEVFYPEGSVEEHLQFKRYVFPEHLLRTDNLFWYAAQRSDAGYSLNGDIDKIYEYRVSIVIQGATNTMAYVDKPPMYISPNRTQDKYRVTVTFYKIINNVETFVKTITFHNDAFAGDPENKIDSCFYYGRYIRLQDIFDSHTDSRYCKTTIEYVQEFTDQQLILRPVFFIPNYHADKIK